MTRGALHPHSQCFIENTLLTQEPIRRSEGINWDINVLTQNLIMTLDDLRTIIQPLTN